MRQEPRRTLYYAKSRGANSRGARSTTPNADPPGARSITPKADPPGAEELNCILVELIELTNARRYPTVTATWLAPFLTEDEHMAAPLGVPIA